MKCAGCDETEAIEGHHVIPQSLGGREGPVVFLCGVCHTVLHGIVTALLKSRPFAPSNDRERRLLTLAQPAVRAYYLKQEHPDFYQDKDLHQLRLTITPRQLARLHKLKADHGFPSLEALMLSVIRKLTKTGEN